MKPIVFRNVDTDHTTTTWQADRLLGRTFAPWSLFLPVAPMSWIDIERPPGRSISPAITDAPATHDKRMSVPGFDNGQFNVTIERRGRDRVPIGFGHVTGGVLMLIETMPIHRMWCDLD